MLSKKIKSKIASFFLNFILAYWILRRIARNDFTKVVLQHFIQKKFNALSKNVSNAIKCREKFLSVKKVNKNCGGRGESRTTSNGRRLLTPKV